MGLGGEKASIPKVRWPAGSQNRCMESTRFDTAIRALAPLRDLLDDPTVVEIMVNRQDDVWVERYGFTPQKHAIRITENGINAAITAIASASRREIDTMGEMGKRPAIVSGKIPGWRIEAVARPVAVNGPCFSMRRLSAKVIELDEYVASGAIPKEVAAALRDAIAHDKNIVVSGGTGSGKTTFMNALLRELSPDDRIVTIETVQELLVTSPNWVALEADEEQGASPSRLLRTCLRFNPKRIIFGELRGPEAFEWMKAGRTGHPGGIATLHANSASDTLRRLEDMCSENRGATIESVRRGISDGSVDVVVFLAKTHRNGRVYRTIKELIQVQGLSPDGQTYLTKSLFTQPEETS